MTKDQVINIQIDHSQKSQYSLNQITFKSGYVAFEKAQTAESSRFKVDQCCYYKITNAGYNGKPDWIEFIKACDAEMFDVSSDYMRGYTIIMQNALTNSVAFHIGRKTQDLDEVHILETASMFAKGVITGAQELAKISEAKPDNAETEGNDI